MNLPTETQTSAIAAHCLCPTREPTDCQRAKVSLFMVATDVAEGKKRERGPDSCPTRTVVNNWLPMMSWNEVWRAAAVAILLCFLHASAHAQHKHTVQEGQTLGAIAHRYRVSVTNLAAANHLKKTSTLRIGQVLRIPPKGVVYVYPGQTLTGIAQMNKVSVNALARANRLSPEATLRVGQRLELPGYSRAEKENKARNAILHGLVTLERPATQESLRVRLFDQRGRIDPKARARLSHFLRDRETKEQRRPNGRLMRVLAYLADHFNGRTIVVVSAFRSGADESSHHGKGRAVDVRVEGIPNETLRDYCLTLPKVGVGYYPRGSFVHIDVRNRAVYWVDWSRPGEPPLYLPPGETPEKYDAGVSTVASPTDL
jgi:uncharacterized protein YcbK (DUF882 family)